MKMSAGSTLLSRSQRQWLITECCVVIELPACAPLPARLSSSGRISVELSRPVSAW